MHLFKRNRPQLISLLKAAADGRRNLEIASFDEAQIRWAVQTGLGPLLYETVAHDKRARSASFWPSIQGAYLTARVITQDLLDAMNEIIDVCRGRIPRLALLKGISICEQHYPAPHLRPMRDIDFLVDAVAVPTVESLLLEVGYRPQSSYAPEFYEHHHHAMPLFHPQRQVWVEVHRGLVPPWSPLGRLGIFSAAHVDSQLEPSKFLGRPVARLSDELQIVHIACHWTLELTMVGGMIAMLDAIYLLKSRPDLDWGRILSWLDGSPAAAVSVYVLLSYLTRFRLIELPSEVLPGLRSRQLSFGRVSLELVHRALDRYVVRGAAFARGLSARNFDILWRTLLAPGPPARNLARLPLNLLPSRRRLSVMLRHPFTEESWCPR